MQSTTTSISDSEIKEIDKHYCSYGDTVHYSDNPKIFRDCNGSFMYDSKDIPYLDLQMWYASCNLGYKNERISKAVIDQINTLPQIASRFLYDYKSFALRKISKS
jgi:4-aminobutyrate aminotransferase-like enzyme